MKPRYTITLTDNELGKEMTIGADSLLKFRQKSITGKSQVYTMLEIFEEELGKASSSTTK